VPETTETTIVDTHDQAAVFRYVADLGNLADWDPSFDESERLDDGPLGEGSRFRGVMSFAGRDIEIAWTLTHYDEPNRVVLDGSSDRFTTQEDIRVAPVDEGTEVTYTGRFDTDAPDLVDALTKPGFFFVGKAAIAGMHERLEREFGDQDEPSV
jgi:hypothetical protein